MEIDAEVGPLASDIQKAQLFRAETIAYVKNCLAMSEKIPGVCPSSNIIQSFEAVSEEVCKVYNEEQRITLIDEIAFFMRTSATEQKARLAPEMPSLPSYIECRMGTSAAGVTCGINEYTYEKALPSAVMKDPDMKVLWAQAQDTVDSLIPLLYLKYGNAQDAIEIAISGLEAEIRNFDQTSGKLLARYSYDPTTQEALSTFIKACQFNCTGNLHWSLATGRAKKTLTAICSPCKVRHVDCGAHAGADEGIKLIGTAIRQPTPDGDDTVEAIDVVDQDGGREIVDGRNALWALGGSSGTHSLDFRAVAAVEDDVEAALGEFKGEALFNATGYEYSGMTF
ncbi:MAG: hypothetical protein Q9165_002200 [Trypethelium subeluteriae]